MLSHSYGTLLRELELSPRKKTAVIQDVHNNCDISLMNRVDNADPRLLLSQWPLDFQHIQRAEFLTHMNMLFSSCQHDESLDCMPLLLGFTKNAILMSKEIYRFRSVRLPDVRTHPSLELVHYRFPIRVQGGKKISLLFEL